MNTIIALKGKSNSGKTSTFHLLANKMIKLGFKEISGNYHEKKDKKKGRGKNKTMRDY